MQTERQMLNLKTLDGVEFDAYQSGAEEAPNALLMIHDWWGLLDYNKEWADRFAELGYLALVIDLYDGERAHYPGQAGEMMRAVDQDEADTKLLAALEQLKRPGRRIATFGWSFGGRQAMQAALLDPEAVDAVVLYYCRMVTDVEALTTLRGPVLSIYATAETTYPEKRNKFTAAMAEAGQQVESHAYDAGHGFVNPTSERYNSEVAEAAWQVTVEFLNRTLGQHG